MGRMNAPDGAAITKGVCGDSMEMYLVIEDDTVSEATFFTDGCDVSRLCGSAAARLSKEKTVKEVLHLSPADVIDTFKEIPNDHIHCAILAVSTLHKALADYLIKTTKG